MSADRLNGLPGKLPPGETIVWQGAPDWRQLLRSLFHARAVAIYFAILAVAGLLAGSPTGAAITLGAGLLGLGVMAVLAKAYAASTVYTLTDRRIVLKIGIALPMSFNLPLRQIDSADLRMLGNGCGDIALKLKGRERIGWALLWPHVRPRHLRQPQPMLRSVPGAEDLAIKLYHCCAEVLDVAHAEPVAKPAPRPARPAPEPVEAMA